ncbi:transcriptional regulator [Pseudonocardia sulfidoxydans NBRC 16205]|uniref:Transcriptional regulator n=1 Tax=Pseudonocardia sulfidoxydans NBRC 16205 TaxID=1223511 RepID=A0A511DLZ0_9PSEU|nr:AraC family transcriptional regulator [Pseudonocardia sulfidoxydans]GEL24804.1 transcriptional regulator [Pseudonocardia sulfidoxydans NBRC 16205]
MPSGEARGAAGEVREFSTRDVDRARAHVSSAYYPLTLRPGADSARFGLRMRTVVLGPLVLGELTYDSDVTKDCGEPSTAYHVNVPTCGEVRTHCGEQHVVATPRTAAVFNPTGRTLLDRWAGGTTQLCLKIDRGVVDQELADRLERPLRAPASFELAMDLESPSSRAWLYAVRLLASELDAPGGLAAQPLFAQEVQRLIVGGLIWGQRHSYSEAIREEATALRPRTVKIAMELMEQQPEHPWTVGELADAAGVGVRALEDGFRRYVGESPTTHLRGIRLEQARKELFAAPPGTTVSEVAYRWGFTHLGRFAGAYARRFGEPPSATLRYGSP